MSHTADNHDEMACPSIVHLSEFKEAAISYIAGFVAQMGTKQLICAACCIALGSRKGYTSSNFIQLKQWFPTFFISRHTIEFLKFSRHTYHKT